MADYGFRAINPLTGSVQIDQNYKNLRLLQKNTHTSVSSNIPFLPDGSVGKNYYKAGSSVFTNADNSTEVDALMLWSSTAYIGSRGRGFRNANAQMTEHPASVAPGATATRYAFTPVPDALPPEHDHGLVVYDALSRPTFSSSYMYLNIVDVVAGSDYNAGLPTRTYPAGRTYACAVASWSGQTRFWENAPYLGNVYQYRIRETGLLARMNGNVLQTMTREYLDDIVYANRINYGNNYDVSFTNRSYAIIVADVTGM